MTAPIYSTRIPQLSRRVHKRKVEPWSSEGRPTVKFPSHFDFGTLLSSAWTCHRSTTHRCLLRGNNPSTSLRKGCSLRFAFERNCGIRVQRTLVPGQQRQSRSWTASIPYCYFNLKTAASWKIF